MANKITRISKDSQQNNSETVTNEYDKEIPKEDIFLQNKGKKLLMNWDWNSIIKEYQKITKY